MWPSAAVNSFAHTSRHSRHVDGSFCTLWALVSDGSVDRLAFGSEDDALPAELRLGAASPLVEKLGRGSDDHVGRSRSGATTVVYI